MSIFNTVGIHRYEYLAGHRESGSVRQTNKGVAMNTESADRTRQAHGCVLKVSQSFWFNARRGCDAPHFVQVAALGASAEYNVWNAGFGKSTQSEYLSLLLPLLEDRNFWVSITYRIESPETNSIPIGIRRA
jgi:hypothetical protein